MSKSAILKSSIAKKYWMALTGLFLCTFLIGHLIGNLQLIMIHGEEGKRAFNEYAYFMSHNPFIKALSYLTYLSIVFHAIDGIMLAVQNKKARPEKYAYENAAANSSSASRNMAVLGTAILIFIVTHMVNFWWKMKYSSDPMPLHVKTLSLPNQMTGQTQNMEVYLSTKGDYIPKDQVEVKHGTEFYAKNIDLKLGEGYKDLHSAVMAFFGQKGKVMSPDGKTDGANSMAGAATALYVLSMLVLAFHLWHGFSSAFQSLGVRHKRYTPIIEIVGKGFAVIVPLLFAIIPVLIFIGYAK